MLPLSIHCDYDHECDMGRQATNRQRNTCVLGPPTLNDGSKVRLQDPSLTIRGGVASLITLIRFHIGDVEPSL